MLYTVLVLCLLLIFTPIDFGISELPIIGPMADILYVIGLLMTVRAIRRGWARPERQQSSTPATVDDPAAGGVRLIPGRGHDDA